MGAYIVFAHKPELRRYIPYSNASLGNNVSTSKSLSPVNILSFWGNVPIFTSNWTTTVPVTISVCQKIYVRLGLGLGVKVRVRVKPLTILSACDNKRSWDY